jgi:hypothetical protein
MNGINGFDLKLNDLEFSPSRTKINMNTSANLNMSDKLIMSYNSNKELSYTFSYVSKLRV